MGTGRGQWLPLIMFLQIVLISLATTLLTANRATMTHAVPRVLSITQGYPDVCTKLTLML